MAFSMKHNSPVLQTLPGAAGSFLEKLQKNFAELSAEKQKFQKRPYTNEEIRNLPTKGTKTVEFENADITKLDNSQLNEATDSAMAYMGRNQGFTITPGKKFKTDYYKGAEPVRATIFPKFGGDTNAITREQIKEKLRTTGNVAVLGGKMVEGVKPYAKVNINPQREAEFENKRFMYDSVMADRRYRAAEERLNKFLNARNHISNKS